MEHPADPTVAPANEPAQPPVEPIEESFPDGYPDRRTEVGRGIQRPAMHQGLHRTYYKFKPDHEYDMYDWMWRSGFCVLGLLLGFLIGHFL